MYGSVIRPHGCPCGFPDRPKKQCSCMLRQVKNYLSKVSGPLLDRIDIHVEVPAVEYGELGSGAEGESSASVREQVVAARRIQTERFQGLKVACNARTIADLEGSEHITAAHLSEAVQYRNLDRQVWM